MAMVAIETVYFHTLIVRDRVRIFRCCLFSLRRDVHIRFCVFLQWNHWFRPLFSETASNLVGHIDVRTRSTGPPRMWHPGCFVPCASGRTTASSTKLLTVQKVAPMTWLFSPGLRFLWGNCWSSLGLRCVLGLAIRPRDLETCDCFLA